MLILVWGVFALIVLYYVVRHAVADGVRDALRSHEGDAAKDESLH